MNVAHICLSNFFVDGRLYQENELVRQHKADGHEVLVVASTETHDDQGRLSYVEPGEYVGPDGVRVVRLAYHPLFPGFLGRKLRVHRWVDDILTRFEPDVILFHGLCGWEITTVARFVARRPGVVFYADSHEDAYNSARTFLSRAILHGLYYRWALRQALPQIRKVLCVSLETIDFVCDMYGVRRDQTEFFPLGGHPVPPDEYEARRSRTRAKLGLGEADILFVQSGKQTARKKLLEALRAFAEVGDPRFRLVVVGSLFDDIRGEAERLISLDGRASFLGWKSPEELNDLLCAADIYLQPGTQSVTMQHSLCAHCAVILDDVPSHSVYHRSNGWLINAANPLVDIFRDVSARSDSLEDMQRASYAVAQELLDYTVLAERVLK